MINLVIPMNKKLIEILGFSLIIVLFITIGYFTYQSYSVQKEDNSKPLEIDNYYSEEYLFNNDYIKFANTISDFSEEEKDIYMYLDAQNILYIKYTNGKTKLNKKISNLPEENVIVYYNNLYDNYYELAALTDKNELYYVDFDITSKNDYKFKKIANNIKEVYIPTYDKQTVHVNKKEKVTTNFIFSDKESQLKYLDYENNSYILKSSLEEVKPYFNYICASNTSSICNDIMLYQTFENKLTYTYKNDTTIKNEENKEIFVKEMFSIFEINTKKVIDLTNINIKDLTKKYSFLFTTYIVDEEGTIYKLEINNEKIKNKEEVTASIHSKKIVNVIKYEKEHNIITKAIIIYMDGTEEQIETKPNKEIVTSTIYDKNQLTNDTIIPEL